MYKASLPVILRPQGQRGTGVLAAYKESDNSMLSQSAGDLVSRAQGRLSLMAKSSFGRKCAELLTVAWQSVQGGKRGEAERVHQYPSMTASSGRARAKTVSQSPWGKTKEGMRLPSGLTSTRRMFFLICALCSALPRVLQPSQHVTTHPQQQAQCESASLL